MGFFGFLKKKKVNPPANPDSQSMNLDAKSLGLSNNVSSTKSHSSKQNDSGSLSSQPPSKSSLFTSSSIASPSSTSSPSLDDELPIPPPEPEDQSTIKPGLVHDQQHNDADLFATIPAPPLKITSSESSNDLSTDLQSASDHPKLSNPSSSLESQQLDEVITPPLSESHPEGSHSQEPSHSRETEDSTIHKVDEDRESKGTQFSDNHSHHATSKPSESGGFDSDLPEFSEEDLETAKRLSRENEQIARSEVFELPTLDTIQIGSPYVTSHTYLLAFDTVKKINRSVKQGDAYLRRLRTKVIQNKRRLADFAESLNEIQSSLLRVDDILIKG